jgi:hypothetical protein
VKDDRCYLVLFNNEQMDREQFKQVLNNSRDVLDWFLFHPGAFAVKLNGRRGDLQSQIITAFPSLDFMIVRLDQGAFSGHGPKQLWDFLKSDELTAA